MPTSVEKEVFQNVANKKAYIVISPFTFYEVLKGENSIAKIKNLYDKLMLIPDFYVANLFNIFEISFSEHVQLSLSIRGGLVPGPLQIRKCKDAQAPHIKWCNTLGCLHLQLWNPQDQPTMDQSSWWNLGMWNL